MKALLPVAGQGTRMAPLGATTPKALLPLFNKPLILWTLESLRSLGITQIVCVIDSGDFGREIRQTIENLAWRNMHVSWVVQTQPLGTGHVLATAKDFFQGENEFLYINGDDIYSPQTIAQVVRAQTPTIVATPVKDPEKWGVCVVSAENHLVEIIEKPDKPVGNLVSIGCMRLPTSIFSLVDSLKQSVRGEYELTDLITSLAHHEQLSVVEAAGYWLPIGYPWHILEAHELLGQALQSKIEGTVEPNVTLHGEVVLPKSSIIKSGTYIEGNVVIGEHTTIGPNAYLRGQVAIGDNCKVGFSVEVKSSVIGSGSQIAHLSYIGDSVLGKSVNVGCGSITSNFRHDGGIISTPVKGKLTSTGRNKFGSIIGDNVMLGAGTVIYPGRKIWAKQTTLPNQVVDKDITP